MLEHLKHYNITGPVVFDTEEIKWDSARTDGNTRQDFTNYCKVFCDTIEHAGYDPMIYANLKWMTLRLIWSSLQSMISGMRIIMRRRSVRMNIKYGSTVKRAQFPVSREM